MVNEKRLIDAKFAQHIANVELFHDEAGVVSWVLSHTPTVDAVEVVRCKDCIHWYEREGVCLKIYSDGAVSPYAWQDRNPDDFCSYGERRTDNDLA